MTNTIQHSSYVPFMEMLVTHASEIINHYYHDGFSQYSNKPDKSYLTQVDLEVEAFYLKEIKNKYPHHSIHSEESGDDKHDSDYTWYLDPLDGTSNFLFGIPLFGSMIALKFKQEIIASAITIPPSRLTAIAIKNEGVIFNHHPFVLPSAIPLDQVTLVSESGKVSQSRIDYQHLMERIYSQVRSIRRFGCIASHVQLLNSGHFHFGLTVGADTHDLFPISLIYRECGYQLFNQSLSPWTINDSTLIVVHPVLTTPVTHLLANQ